MDDNNQKETIHGYEIQRAIVFENNRGFAFAENPAAVTPYVTWMFTEEENGAREYYWGHYTSNKDAAVRDYELRIAEYQKDYGQSERDAYKYYSTQRPVDIGTLKNYFSKQNDPADFSRQGHGFMYSTSCAPIFFIRLHTPL